MIVNTVYTGHAGGDTRVRFAQRTPATRAVRDLPAGRASGKTTAGAFNVGTYENGDPGLDIETIRARRARFSDLWLRIFGRREHARELEDGYALRYPATEEWRSTVEEYVASVREMVPESKTRYEILAEGEDGGLWLHIRGPGVREKVRENLTQGSERSAGRSEARRRREWRSRILTNRFRVLPDFILIGAPRCGTTSVFEYVCQHPSVVEPFWKEANFFDVKFHRGLSHYRACFPTVFERRRVRARTGGFCTGEATPTYMFHPRAPERVHRALPRAKLLAVLRDPVERAYSLYKLKRGTGFEPLSFEEAIDREDRRLAGELDKMLADDRYESHARHHLAYLSAGIYVDQLLRWKKLFPPERLMVLSFDAMLRSVDDSYRGILEFLGLPGHPAPEMKKLNTSLRVTMDPSTRERLREFFRPHNDRLWDVLGVDYGWNG